MSPTTLASCPLPKKRWQLLEHISKTQLSDRRQQQQQQQWQHSSIAASWQMTITSCRWGYQICATTRQHAHGETSVKIRALVHIGQANTGPVWQYTPAAQYWSRHAQRHVHTSCKKTKRSFSMQYKQWHYFVYTNSVSYQFNKHCHCNVHWTLCYAALCKAKTNSVKESVR